MDLIEPSEEYNSSPKRYNNRSGDKSGGQSFKWMNCKFYKDGDDNSCRHGSTCAFAHGEYEKIERPQRERNSDAPRENRGTKRTASSANLPTALCVHFIRNSCNKGDECRYSHDQEEFKKALPRTYKTSLCSNYMSTGKCNRESACGFAHGRYELRPFGFKGNFEEKIKEMPNWKTVGCQFYMKTGQCRNSEDCPFAHGEQEMRMSKQSPFDPISAQSGAGGNMDMMNSGGMGGPGSICKFFMEGDCKFGRKCQLSHGMPNSMGVRGGSGGGELLDYTRDITPASMRDVAAPPAVPSMTKDNLYSEFMDFLNQKFQGPSGGFAAQNSMSMEDTMNFASMAADAQGGGMFARGGRSMGGRNNANPLAGYKSARGPQAVQHALRESMMPPPQMSGGSKLANRGGMSFKMSNKRYMGGDGDQFDDIF